MMRLSRWLGAGRLVLLATLSCGLVGFAWSNGQAAEHARLRAGALGRLAVLRQTRVEELERELAETLAAHESVRDFVQERIAAEAAARAAREERLLAATRPAPEGIRLALETLHDLLRRAGHGSLRFLRVRAIEEKSLRGVELFDAVGGEAGGAILWQAERAELRFDRASGALTVHLHDGHVVRSGVRSELGAEGEPLVLHGVHGPELEERLPYLVVAEGLYPQPEAAPPDRPGLDPFTAASWRRRLDDLLAQASTPYRYRVSKLQHLEGGRFGGVLLLAHGEGKRLEQVAEVDWLTVAIDERAGTVELELVGGVLHRAGGDTNLPAEPPGQRVLLPGVAPEAASRILTGMVRRR